MARRLPMERMRIPASEWNRIQEPSNRTGTRNSKRFVQPDFVRAVGINKSSATLQPGSPVYYTTFVQDQTPTDFIPKQPGYFELRNCFWPHASGDRTDFNTRNFRYEKIGVVLDTIGVDDVGSFAISGLCAVKIASASTGLYARPTVKPNSFETQLTASTNWGFPILARYGDWGWIDLSRLHRWMLLGTVRTGGLAAGSETLVTVPESGSSGADFPAITTGSTIAASSSIALWPTDTQWQAMRIC